MEMEREGLVQIGGGRGVVGVLLCDGRDVVFTWNWMGRRSTTWEDFSRLFVPVRWNGSEDSWC